MSPKSLALAVGAALILALAVYLFVQVRATPAQAGSTATATEPEVAPAPATVAPAAPAAQPSVRPEPAARRPEWAPTRPPPGTPPGAAAETPEADERRVDLKKDNLMELANKAYDRQDFDEAIAIASRVLKAEPTNVRMLRIVVSANCIQGDVAVAQAHFEKLPKFDREQMKQRCDRYGVTFRE